MLVLVVLFHFLKLFKATIINKDTPLIRQCITVFISGRGDCLMATPRKESTEVSHRELEVVYIPVHISGRSLRS